LRANGLKRERKAIHKDILHVAVGPCRCDGSQRLPKARMTVKAAIQAFRSTSLSILAIDGLVQSYSVNTRNGPVAGARFDRLVTAQQPFGLNRQTIRPTC